MPSVPFSSSRPAALGLDRRRENQNRDAVGTRPGSARPRRGPRSVWVGGIRTSRTATCGSRRRQPVEKGLGVAGLKHDLHAFCLEHLGDALTQAALSRRPAQPAALTRSSGSQASSQTVTAPSSPLSVIGPSGSSLWTVALPTSQPDQLGGQDVAGTGDVAEAARLDHRGAEVVAVLLAELTAC